MAKINRRDYLMRMGAGAGAILGASKLDLFAQSKNRGQVRRTLRKANPARPADNNSILSWPITHLEPVQDAFVTAIFRGLMGFCYNTKHNPSPSCEVGFHPGNGKHALQIEIYENYPDCKPHSPIIHIAPKVTTTMVLQVVGQSSPPLDFFQAVDPADPENPFFDRLKGHKYDFRWLPDLDGADFYPEHYSQHNVYKARLYVRHGTFYTRARTNSTFNLVDAMSNQMIRPFGHLALYMAAALNVAGPGDYVSFQINKEAPIKLEQKRGVNYQIVFTNECMYPACPKPVPNDPLETKRNDFHYNREVLKIPSGRTKYALKLDRPADPSPLNYCHQEIHSKISDEAPCMGSGYGGTGGFPP